MYEQSKGLFLKWSSGKKRFDGKLKNDSKLNDSETYIAYCLNDAFAKNNGKLKAAYIRLMGFDFP